MSKSNKKYAYCVECGTKNERGVKKCSKCHKNPDPKDHAFKDYILEKISGKAEDSFFELVTKFIKKYFYGTLLTCSLVFTGVSLITNVAFDNNYIEKMSERPTLKYLGEGLVPEEVLHKYIDAAREHDLATIYGLRLENIKPDLYREILSKMQDSQHEKPIETHSVTQFADIYFRDGREYKVHKQDEDMGEYSHGKYGDYEYERYAMNVVFCVNNVCPEDNENAYYNMFWLTDEIELVKVDDNYYVTGEKHHLEQMNLDQIIMRGMIYNAGGDMTKVDFSHIYDAELCGVADDCFEKFGGMEVHAPNH